MPEVAAPADANPAQTPTAPDAASAAASTTDSGGSNWFDALTGRAPLDEASAAGAEPADGETEQSAPGAQGSDATPTTEQPAPEPQRQSKPQQDSPGPDDTVRLTRMQLEREIQSRADKLIAKQQREAAKRQQEADLERKAREDPYAFSEDFLSQRDAAKRAEEQAEDLNRQTESVHELIRTTARQFDAAIVTPVITSLPPETQHRLLQEIQPVGVDGRSRLVAAALAEVRKAERAAGRAEGEKAAEQKLRKNAAFRKELLAELRGSEDEPEQLPNGSRSRPPTNMEDVIRAWLNVGRA